MSYFAKRLQSGTPSLEDPHQVLDRVVHLLEKGQSVNIVGEGGAGKTMLLRQACHPEFMKKFGVAPEQFLIVGVTGEDILGRTATSFWTDVILPDLSESALQRGRAELAELIRHASTTPGDIRRAVDEVFYKLQLAKLRMLLGWDDFDWVQENTEFDESFFNFLRSLAMEYQVVTYLIASECPLVTFWSLQPSQAAPANVSPFFNIFHSITLNVP